jgi:hypothetical protein
MAELPIAVRAKPPVIPGCCTVVEPQVQLGQTIRLGSDTRKSPPRRYRSRQYSADARQTPRFSAVCRRLVKVSESCRELLNRNGLATVSLIRFRKTVQFSSTQKHHESQFCCSSASRQTGAASRYDSLDCTSYPGNLGPSNHRFVRPFRRRTT